MTNTDKTCQKEAKAKVVVNKCGVYAPDIFSPNNDQQNDVFFVQAGDCIKQIKELIIYNRWGEVIFRDENFLPSDPNHGWNGSYLGKALEPGTYPYKMTVAFADQEMNDHIYTGVVMLMK